MSTPQKYDVIIVGGGPAGLSAALVLGRCRRRVLLFDAGHPRNERSQAMHGFLSRDGISPAEFTAVCREQLRPYDSVEVRTAEVAHAHHEDGEFSVELHDGSREYARVLLLATGLVDERPQIPGFEQFYGRSVHHCPYCDGWEHRDRPLAVIGAKEEAAELAIEMLLWSKDLVLCTNGPVEFPVKLRGELAQHGIEIREEPIASLEGEGGELRSIRFASGEVLAREAAFFSPGQRQRSRLGEELGCEFCTECEIQCSESAETCVSGLFAAGNASRGLQLVIMAAAEGTQAAFAINETLCARDRSAVLGRAAECPACPAE